MICSLCRKRKKAAEREAAKMEKAGEEKKTTEIKETAELKETTVVEEAGEEKKTTEIQETAEVKETTVVEEAAEMEEAVGDPPEERPNFIVSEGQLMALFTNCLACHAPATAHIEKVIGTYIEVRQVCSKQQLG